MLMIELPLVTAVGAAAVPDARRNAKKLLLPNASINKVLLVASAPIAQRFVPVIDPADGVAVLALIVLLNIPTARPAVRFATLTLTVELL
jgi:hypothetical protein